MFVNPFYAAWYLFDLFWMWVRGKLRLLPEKAGQS